MVPVVKAELMALILNILHKIRMLASVTSCYWSLFITPISGFVQRANHAMNLIIQENADLLGRVRELRQDLLRERAQLCQLTSDKVEAEQQLHVSSYIMRPLKS